MARSNSDKLIGYNSLEKFSSYLYGTISILEFVKKNYYSAFSRGLTFLGLYSGSKIQEMTSKVDRRGFLVAGIGAMMSATDDVKNVINLESKCEECDNYRVTGLFDVGFSFLMFYKHYSVRANEIENLKREENKELFR